MRKRNMEILLTSLMFGKIVEYQGFQLSILENGKLHFIGEYVDFEADITYNQLVDYADALSEVDIINLVHFNGITKMNRGNNRNN